MELHCMNLGLLLPGLLPVEVGIPREGRNDASMQRAFDEVFGCQDTLARIPAKPSLLTRVVAEFVAIARWLAPHQPGSARRVIPPVTTSTITR